ncbi:hypothetical protein [Anabaena azotica]|uniref:Uncharacterized protein n=1 Tax=Anabaena azotica FACHB-119 TaxID=947527 RepID=A0ABR8DAI5_9NOST|nr:hypothetical protein [Anabaena azotica]MBD2503922.1 hypothetical protein [Anabaena azotica FACHB-119]
MNKLSNLQQQRSISLLLMIAGIGILLFTSMSGYDSINKNSLSQFILIIFSGIFSSLVTIFILKFKHRQEIKKLEQKYSQLENTINFNFSTNGVQIYSSSVVVINYDGSCNHCPTVSAIGKYSSCEDYLKNGVIRYLEEESLAITPSASKVLVSIVEGKISHNGLIEKTGGLDKILYVYFYIGSRKLIEFN